ncbi:MULTISPECIES: molybdenum cofactor biosynthesis protein B [unclassified Salinisphaera]|uniref:molybdenum cofactor biosynthesis protein B n=1 Tax=unclassified Salinisphaera TaxID=2649847 RepID=UPI000C38D87E|nr:molybdenum cofactor biosynthesis protein B [Salinisphaera sp.]MBS61759.1 molybdenum cofactor biosynthesis protein B [Salinisphaera sp.]
MSDRFVPLHIAVLTVSDTRTEASDKSGRLLVDRIEAAGHHLYEKAICTDDMHEIRARVARWIADEKPDVVITTGGTGLTGRDVTPQAVEVLFDRRIDGFGEMFRVLSYDTIGTSTLQSRAIAGVAKATFIFCLPGSTGACADGWDKLIADQIDARTRPCNLQELLPRLTER